MLGEMIYYRQHVSISRIGQRPRPRQINGYPFIGFPYLRYLQLSLWSGCTPNISTTLQTPLTIHSHLSRPTMPIGSPMNLFSSLSRPQMTPTRAPMSFFHQRRPHGHGWYQLVPFVRTIHRLPTSM